MAKVQVSWVVSEEDIRTEVLDVGATSVTSTVAPAIPGGLVLARIQALSGAVHVIAGRTPVASASAGLHLEAGDDPVEWRLPSGSRIASIAAFYAGPIDSAGNALPANFDSLPRDTRDRDASGALLSEVRTDGVYTWTWTYDRDGVVGGPVVGESGWVRS